MVMALALGHHCGTFVSVPRSSGSATLFLGPVGAIVHHHHHIISVSALQAQRSVGATVLRTPLLLPQLFAKS